MPRLRPDAKSWPLYEAIGSWAVAMVLVLFEGFFRHFQDQGGLAFIGILLGLPPVVAAEKRRRERNAD